MKKYIPLLFTNIYFLICCVGCNTNTDNVKLKKIALREIGNELLVLNNDTKSLIHPIIEIEPNEYQISFQENLEISPDSLVKISEEIFLNYNFSKKYIVEVLDCITEEVVYSYQIKENTKNNLISCIQRTLPKKCYRIHFEFINSKETSTASGFLIVVITILGIGVFVVRYFFSKKKSQEQKEASIASEYLKVGNTRFYQDQNKFEIDAVTIPLTSKECELFALLIDSKNEVVKRDTLIKEVWENKGVVVGRSLDTYISKIRKKIQQDSSLKITNVHGVGYKLEVLKPTL